VRHRSNIPAGLAASIDALLARFGLRWHSAQRLARLHGDVWRVACDTVEVVLRTYPAAAGGVADTQDVEAEIRWLRAMADEGLPTPRPWFDRSGRALQPWQPDPAQPACHAVLLAWVPGRRLDRGLRPVHLRRTGELTARMHVVAERLVRAGAIPTRRLTDGPDLRAWASADATPASWLRHLSAAEAAVLRETAQRLLADLASLPHDATSWGFVHGDLHVWNLLFQRDAAAAIDFGDCGFGHHAQDLAATLQYLRHPLVHNHDPGALYGALHDALLEGYARHRTLPPMIERQVEVYIVARMLNTVEWVVGTWPRVDLRPWGPGFLRQSQTVFARYLR